jgi:arylformamidase
VTLIDISAGLGPDLPVWPTSVGWSVGTTRDVRRGDPVTESLLRADVHSGTHVDAPLHHLENGFAVEEFALEAFVGDVLVLDACGFAELPESLVDQVPLDARRVLFRTDNSERALMRRRKFSPGYVGLSTKAATALSEREGLLLVGNDYLSVQPFEGDDEVHRVLLRRGVALLEGLDLTDVAPGWYELIAAPVLIRGAEAAPVRALLRQAAGPNRLEGSP